MSEANGKIPAFNPANFVDPNLLKLAEDLLAGVKNGSIVGLGAVAIAPNGGIAAPMIGVPALVNLGADILKAQVLRNVTGQASPIIRPAAAA